MSIQLAALLTNIGLAVLKFTVGTIASSRALIADAFNSAGDVFATFVAWVAFRYGKMPPDDNHPYGHGNAEALAGLLIGGMLCATGGFICIDAFFFFREQDRGAPEVIAIYAAAVTAVIGHRPRRRHRHLHRALGLPAGRHHHRQLDRPLHSLPRPQTGARKRGHPHARSAARDGSIRG
ncbi:MAG: cation diffusion facilitator family transporter [Planctomycetota bacterium]|jgi:cation diffusion facilitator family transporter